MSSDDHFPAGARIGNYEVMNPLGRGGMGAVFLVRQIFLNKRFALKVLDEELARLPEYVDVFRNEARMLASLRHPHIVQVHDFGTAGTRHYFVMDFVDGGTLDEWRRKRGGKLPPGETLAVLRSVASCLAHAHGMGIVHRDLKPENFLMERDGVLKVSDFGLARLSRDPSTKVAVVRRTGGDTYMHFARQAMDSPELKGGTEGFMAPELRDGGPGDARSDVYALGVIGRLLLTGRGAEVGMKPVSKLVPGLDPQWDAVLDKCLSEDPADRYADGAELLRDLEVLAGEADRRLFRKVPAWVWMASAPALALLITAGVVVRRVAAKAPVVAATSSGIAPLQAGVAVAIPPPLSLHRIREYGLKPADAELGYGLYRTGSPPSIAGWRTHSRAVWKRKVEPGNYRLTAMYHYKPELGAKPARISVRIGDASLSVYIPASLDGEGPMRAVLGEIEVGGVSDSVEMELIDGPPVDEVHLRATLLVIEPLSPKRETGRD